MQMRRDSPLREETKRQREQQRGHTHLTADDSSSNCSPETRHNLREGV